MSICTLVSEVAVKVCSCMFRIQAELLLQVPIAASASRHEATGSLRAAGADDAAGTR